MANGVLNIFNDKILPTNAPGSQSGSGKSKDLLFSPPVTNGQAGSALNHITGQFVAQQNAANRTAAVGSSTDDDTEKTVVDFLREIQSQQPFDEAALAKKKVSVELKLDKPPREMSVADYDAATWKAIFNKAGYSILTDKELGTAVQALKDIGYKSTNDGFTLSNLRKFDALPGAMFVKTDQATIEKAKRAGQAVLQFQEYKSKQFDANQEKAQSETNQMFADQARVLWNSAVNIVEGTINTALDAASTNGGTNPLPLLNPNRPQVDFSAAKTDYRSEMMRRDLNGKVDGDGIKAGQFIETGVTIAAPLVIGMATKPSVPLQELGLPRTSAATTATEARVANGIANATKVEETASVSNTANATERTIEFSAKQLQRKYKHADVFGIPENYTPANAARFQTAIEQHISNPTTRVIQGTYRKTNSVTHFVNPQTGVNVIRDASGQFHSAWKLNAEQLQNVLNRGSL